jgi:hypothetical protein
MTPGINTTLNTSVSKQTTDLVAHLADLVSNEGAEPAVHS